MGRTLLSDAFGLDFLGSSDLLQHKTPSCNATAKIKCNSDGQECPSHTYFLLHRADSDIAANILQASNQNVPGIKQAHRSHDVSNGLHGFHFTPEFMQKSGIRMRRRVAELSD